MITYSIDVRERILGLAVFSKNTWCDLVNLADELEHWVIGQVLECELALRDVSRVSLAQDCVTVARNDLTSVESRP